MFSRRSIVLATISFIIIFVIYDNRDVLPSSFSTTGASRTGASPTPLENTTKQPQDVSIAPIESPKTGNTFKDGSSPLSPQVLNYFDQVFSEKPALYDFPALRQQCEHTKWPEDNVYLKCGGMSAGLTSIISQVKVCLKMAVEAGVGLVLPAMPLRDSTDLKEFNFMNGDAYLTYDKWFDAEFLIDQMKRVCPQMKIIHPDQLDTIWVPVKHRWDIDIGKAPGYQQFSSYFWCGKPFKPYFEGELAKLQSLEMLNPNKDDSKKGITVVTIASNFLIFRITDDPTGNDLKLWNDLSHIIRFREAPRQIVAGLLSHLDRPFYGVHFRVESDTIWSSLENQLAVDLDALDKAWAMYGKPGQQKPLVYLACGDQDQIEKFVVAGKERGWEVTHKWALAQNSAETLQMINELAFDFQGAVDMGIMIRSHFFLGITGSAFSSSIANARDITGRYRGSTFTVFDDGNARTHLFNDGDASHYACCL
jgi:hypothetical protein